MKIKSLKRFICVILTVVMMFTLSVSAFAEASEETIATAEPQAANTVYGPGEWDLGEFSFYDYNIGRYRTFSGKRIRMKLAYKQPGNDNYTADMLVSCYSYDDGLLWQRFLCAGQREPDANGYRHVVFDWTPIRNGGDYRLDYIAYACGDMGVRRNATCHVWVEVE